MTSTASVNGARSTQGPTLHRLTSLRWFAALLVFVSHARTQFDDWEIVRHMWVGRAGVSFFFILSGFVLAWSYRREVNARRFYRRRFARIYPAYAVSLVVWAGALSYAERDLGPWWAPFLLIQSWINDQAYLSAVNAVAWSLSVEAFFYLSFPLLWALLHGRSVRSLAVAALGCLALTVALVSMAQHDPANFLSWHWATYAFPPARLPEFVLGMTLALLMRHGVVVRRGVLLAVVAVVGGLWWAADVPWLVQPVAVTLVPFALLIYTAASADLTGQRGILTHPWLVVLGQWSYCFYLVHTLGLLLVSEAMPGVRGVLGVTLGLATALVGAAALHYLVERPAERWLRGGGRSRQSLRLPTAEAHAAAGPLARSGQPSEHP